VERAALIPVPVIPNHSFNFVNNIGVEIANPMMVKKLKIGKDNSGKFSGFLAEIVKILKIKNMVN
jgi:hypothetical protein